MATVTITSKGKQLPVNTDFKFASGALAYFNDTQVKNSKPSGVELDTGNKHSEIHRVVT